MKILLFVLLSLVSFSVLAETKIETIELQHRLAEDLLPDIEPFLPEQATARAFQNLIIIKADTVTINEVRDLIEKLDTPLQRIKITVVRTDQNLTDKQKTRTTVNVEVNNGDVNANARVNRWSTKNNRNKDLQYRAQGIAGYPISISMSEDIPQQEQLVFIGPYGYGAGVQTDTSYISLDNGFQAVARLLADQQVHVDIHPFFSELSRRNGTIEQSQVITTLVGPVGQWLELGHISNEENIDNTGVKSYHSHQTQHQRLYLKVEPVPYN